MKKVPVDHIKGQSLLTKIGLIGDIHAEPRRLGKSLQHLHQMELDSILCTGDIVDGMGNVDDCVQLLLQFNVKTVLGNHDSWFLKDTMRTLPDATPVNMVNIATYEYLQDLPLVLEMDTNAGKLMLCHGLGKHLMAKVREDDYGYALENNFELQDLISGNCYRYIVNGHTHHQMVRDFGGLTLINAGSMLYDDPCFQVLNFATGCISIFSAENPEIDPVTIKIPGSTALPTAII